MPVEQLVVLVLIIAFFLTFMAVLGWGAWWSNQKLRRARAEARLAPVRGAAALSHVSNAH
jgi:hypothetical protein